MPLWRNFERFKDFVTMCGSVLKIISNTYFPNKILTLESIQKEWGIIKLLSKASFLSRVKIMHNLQGRFEVIKASLLGRLTFLLVH